MRSIYRMTLLFAVILAMVVVTLGAYVRLSDAGLGCPDWPGCYGKLVGVPAHAHEIDAAQQAFPDSPVQAPKAWKEMVHRYFAGTLGLVIVALAWLARREQRPVSWPLALVLLVGFQAALGMWTVTLLLKPLVVTLHLLGGLATFGILFGLWWRERLVWQISSSRIWRWAPWGWGLLLLVACQITLGGWTSANYAAMACPDYPLCQGALMPEMDWRHAFTIDRELGQTAAGEGLPLSALAAIHWLHRWFAIVVVTAVFGMGWRLRREPGLRAYGMALMHAVLLQWLIGVGNVWLQWPLAFAVLHNTGAALLLAVTLATALRLSRPA